MADTDQKPTPDPTILTTEQLLREVDRVKELTTAELKGLERLFTEKFHSFDRQFALIEAQRIEQKKDTKDAVDAAFSAAKEAVKEQTTASDRAIAKSENSMLEQLKQLSTTFNTQISGVQDVLSDLKERVGRGESGVQAVREDRGKASLESDRAVNLLGLVVAVLVLGLLAYAAFH